MPDPDALLAHFDGELLTPGRPGYDAARQPAHGAHHDRYPRFVLRCRSVADVVAAIGFARGTGEHVAVRGGGHCFARRSSTEGLLIALAGLDGVRVADDGHAVIGAGACLGQVYTARHACGRTLPAGCGATVGIAGLTLGGGIGLLRRPYGLTCDRLVGAQVVLADGRVRRGGHEQGLPRPSGLVVDGMNAGFALESRSLHAMKNRTADSRQKRRPT